MAASESDAMFACASPIVATATHTNPDQPPPRRASAPGRPAVTSSRNQPSAALTLRSKMLSHWRARNSEPAIGGELHEARASTSRLDTNHHQHHFRHASSSPLPPTYTADASSYLQIIAQEGDRSTDTAGPKLWHSLVLPLVLACVIFLVALWTRQLSLALTNDTLLMVMILAGLFVVLSGVAFWLSCDQYFQTAPPQTTGEQVGGHHHPHCPHFHRHPHNHSTVDIEVQPTTTTTRHCQHEGEKCCQHIAVIDCQPPDYHAALLNSKPIRNYLVLSRNDEELDTDSLLALRVHFDLNDGQDDDNDDDDDDDDEDDERLELPTYEQLELHKDKH